MKVVIDTNILVMSIPRKSNLNPIFKSLNEGKFELCITTDILNEYTEISQRMLGYEISELVMQALINLPNVIPVITYFSWNLLADADDNKFVDCAVAASADFIVTHDKHFNILNKIQFPQTNLINAEKFMSLLTTIK